MAKVQLNIIDKAVREVSGRAAIARVAAGAYKGLQQSIRLVQEHHKKKEWVRGSKAMRAAGGRLRDASTHPDKLTVRTGLLSKSYTIKMRKGEAAAYYGSDLKYARIHEYGFSGTQSVPSHKVREHWREIDKAFGKSIPARSVKVAPHVRAAFSRQMKVRKRPGLQNTMKATAAGIEKIMGDKVMAYLEGRES